MSPSVRSFSVAAISHLGLLTSREESKAVFGTLATASLVCRRLPQRRNSLLLKYSVPAAGLYPTAASSTVGNGRQGQVHCAADIPVAVAGRRGTFPSDADIPALLRKGALATVAGNSVFAPYETGY